MGCCDSRINEKSETSNKIDNNKRIPCTDSTRIINYKQYNQNKINKLKEKKGENQPQENAEVPKAE